MKISQMVSELWSGHEYMVEMANGYVQCSKGKQELPFMCSALCLMVVYIGMKFCENISNGFRVLQRTQNYEVLTDGWTGTQNFRRYNIIPRHLCGGA